MRRFEASPRGATPKGQPSSQLYSTVFGHDYLRTAPPTFVAHQVLTMLRCHTMTRQGQFLTVVMRRHTFVLYASGT
jgi:hypothetical protein